MNDDEWNLIWTCMWFIFIGISCFTFKSGIPLFLLFVWFAGWRA